MTTNLPPDLILIVGADAAGVVEQRAGERGRLSAVWTVAAQVQRLLAVDHAVWVTGGRTQVRTVGACSCVGGGRRVSCCKKHEIHSTSTLTFPHFKSLMCAHD